MGQCVAWVPLSVVRVAAGNQWEVRSINDMPAIGPAAAQADPGNSVVGKLCRATKGSPIENAGRFSLPALGKL
jgi:hypothetical protein